MGSSKSILHLIHHRSKNRIRDFGEVFTPEKYVNQMLDMLDKSVWTDTNTVFYEPTCGHGNFVEVVVKRRLDAFLKQANKQKIEKAHFYAVANTLNNLWAIDIDSKNISLCRERVQKLVFDFLSENSDNSNPFLIKNRNFLTHVLCCIDWQIHENEALSCLEKDSVKAKKLADKTAISREWLKKNKHKPINFEMNWCQYFKSYKKENTVPSEYMNKLGLVSSLIDDKKKSLKKEKISKSNYKPDYNSELPIAT